MAPAVDVDTHSSSSQIEWNCLCEMIGSRKERKMSDGTEPVTYVEQSTKNNFLCRQKGLEALQRKTGRSFSS